MLLDKEVAAFITPLKRRLRQEVKVLAQGTVIRCIS